jgi:hypothetical protein
MTKKSHAASTKATRQGPAGMGHNLLLTLTLIPAIIGLLLIGAWILDILIFEDAQSQVIVGILFMLLGFTASNALQRHWRLAAGWGLLVIADLVVLLWLDVRAQIVAIALGLVGLILLAIEFYGQYRSRAEIEKK